MNEVECLKKRIVEKDIFINNILNEMKEIYELVDGLKVEASSIEFNFSKLIDDLNERG